MSLPNRILEAIVSGTNWIIKPITGNSLQIRTDTSDGSDDQRVDISGGGGFGAGRGARIIIYGADSSAGTLHLLSSNTSGADILLDVQSTNGYIEQSINGGTSAWRTLSTGRQESQGAYDLDIGDGDFIVDTGSVTADGTTQGTAASVGSTGQFTLVNGANGTKGVILDDSARS